LKFEDVVLTLEEDATYRFEIDADGSDLVLGVGTNDTLTLESGGVLEMASLDGTDPLGTWWTLFDGFETINGSMDDWTVLFAGQQRDAVFSQQGSRLSVMVAVPEPSITVVVLSALMIALGGLRRRRR
jgi:hypothetical protein